MVEKTERLKRYSIRRRVGEGKKKEKKKKAKALTPRSFGVNAVIHLYDSDNCTVGGIYSNYCFAPAMLYVRMLDSSLSFSLLLYGTTPCPSFTMSHFSPQRTEPTQSQLTRCHKQGETDVVAVSRRRQHSCFSRASIACQT